MYNSRPSIIKPVQPVVPQASLLPQQIVPPVDPLAGIEMPLPHRNPVRENLVLDYNNPYVINSMADVVLTTFRKDMHRRKFGGLENIPILNIIPNTLSLLYDSTAKPIREGDWGAAGLNLLTNLSETLDVVASPTKALLMGEGIEGAKDALGFGKYGRGNYDWNTGNIVSDIALELVSDPLNWVTLFGKGAIVQMLKKGIKPILQQVAPEVAESIIKDVAKKTTRSLFETGAKSVDEALAEQLAKAVGRDGKLLFNDQAITNLKKLVLDDMTVNTMAALTKVVRPVEAFENTLGKVAFYSSGFGTGYWLVKKAFNAGSAFIHAKTEDMFKQYTTPSGNIDPFAKEAADETFANLRHTLKDVLNMKDVPPDVVDAAMTRSLQHEKQPFYEWLKTDLTKKEFADFESKTKYIDDFMKTRFEMNSDEMVEFMAHISVQDESLNKFIDVLRKLLNQEQQLKFFRDREFGLRSKAVRDFLQTLVDVKKEDRLVALRDFVQANFSMSMEDYIKYLEQPEFNSNYQMWFKELIRDARLPQMEANAFYVHERKPLFEQFKNLIQGKALHEGSTRLDLFNKYVEQEHGINFTEYMERMRLKAIKYPSVYEKFYNEMRVLQQRLELRDVMAKKLSARSWRQQVRQYRTQASPIIVKRVSQAQTKFEHFLNDYFKKLNNKLDDATFSLDTFQNVFVPVVNNHITNILKIVEDPIMLEDKQYEKLVEAFKIAASEFVNKLEDLFTPDDFKDFGERVIDALDDIRMRLDSIQNIPSAPTESKPLKSISEGLKKGTDLFQRALLKITMPTAPDQLKEAMDILAKTFPNEKPEALLEKYKQVLKDNVFTTSVKKVLRFETQQGIKVIGEKEINDLRIELLRMTQAAQNVIKRTTKQQINKFGIGHDDDIANAVAEYFKTRKTADSPGPHIFEIEDLLNLNIAERFGEELYSDMFNIADRNLKLAMSESWQNAFSDIFSTEPEVALDGISNMVNLLRVLDFQKDVIDLKPIQPLINLFEPYLYKFEKVRDNTNRIHADVIRYMLKQDQDYVTSMLMTNETIDKMMQTLLDPKTKLGSVLETAIRSEDAQAQDFRNRLEAYKNYRDFLELLYNYVGIDDGIKSAITEDKIQAFTNVLQNNAISDPQTLKNNYYSVFYQIMRKMEEQLQTGIQPESYSLEALVKRPEFQTPEIQAELAKWEGHRALDDCHILRIVRETLLQEDFLKEYGDDIKVYELDIETDSLDGVLGKITQIGMLGDDLEMDLVVEHFNSPNPSVIRKMYNLPSDTPNEEALKFYQEDQLKRATVATEAAALKKLIETIIPLATDPRAIVNIHNGTKFDKGFILNRMKHYMAVWQGTPEEEFYAKGIAALQVLKTEDSLKMFHKKAGLPTISDFEKDQFYMALEHLIDAQIAGRAHRLVQPLDTTMAKELQVLLRNMEVNVKADPQIMQDIAEAKAVVDTIFDEFRNIKKSNQALGEIEINKAAYESEYFRAVNGQHIMQTLSTYIDEQGVRQAIPGIKQVGVKKVYNMPVVTDWFDFQDIKVKYMQKYNATEEAFYANDALFEYYTTQAKILENNYQRLKNIDFLKNLALYRNTTSALFPDWAKFVTPKDFVHQVALDKTVIDGFFKKIARNDTKLIKEDIYRIYSPDYVDMLQQTVSTTDRTLKIHQKWYNASEDDMNKMIDIQKDALWQTRQQNRTFSEKQRIWAEEHYPELAARRERWARYFAGMDAERVLRETEQAAREAERVVKETQYLEQKAALETKLVADFKEKIARDFLKAGDYSNADGYRKAVARAQDDFGINVADALYRLGDSLGESEAHRAVIQKRAVGVQSIQNLLDVEKAMIANMDDAQVLEHLQKHRLIPELIAAQEVVLVMKKAPEELFRHLIHNAKSLIMFDMSKYIQYPELSRTYQEFLAQEQAYAEAGIKIIQDLGYTYIVPSGTREVRVINGQCNIPLPSQLDDIDFNHAVQLAFDKPEEQALRDAYAKVRAHLDFINVEQNHRGVLGQIYTRQGMADILGNIPENVRKLIPNPNTLDDFFFKGIQFNHSVLGPIDARRVHYMTKETLQQYMPTDMLSILSSTYSYLGKALKSEVEYMSFFFDNSLSINVGHLATTDDQALLDAMQKSTGFKLAALIVDKNATRGVRVVEIPARNLHSIETARRLNAVLLSTQTFSKAFETINESGFNNRFLNFWHKINYLYKVGYLSLNPGVLFRNIVDSTMKNYIASEDPMGMTRSYFKAFRLYSQYYATVQDMIHKAPHGKLTLKWMKEDYFPSGFAKMAEEEYMLIHGFIEDGPSAGMIHPLEKYYNQNVKRGAWGTVTHMANLLMMPTQYVEQISRLAEYFWAIEDGMAHTRAYELISKTHFDYAIKTKSDTLTELLFPFYTFTMNNYNFWIDMVTSRPWLGNVLRDVMTPVWNFDELDFEQLNRNKSMQYQVLAGNLKLDDTGLMLKLNPSFMDVYKMITDPVNTFKSKLNTPIQMLFQNSGIIAGSGADTGFAGIQSLLEDGSLLSGVPFIGGILSPYLVQGPKYYARTGRPLNLIAPSIFGAEAQYRKKKYTLKPYVTKAKYTKRYYAKRYYGKRVKKARKMPYMKRFQKYYPKYSRSRSFAKGSYYAENFYQKLYTKTGASRLKIRSIPVTPETLKVRVKDYWYFFK